ncbi:MAG: DNA-processing protein DprA [Rickettsiales bacterium]|jgi:DNA processing protein|nr:DNA-processing protein DprA [Rickettsiales bacterium]
MDDEKLTILKLSRTTGFTSTMFYRLLKKCYSTSDMIGNIDQICRKNVKICSDENIQLEFEKCEKLGAKLITYRDSEYPRYLRVIQPFPLVLTCRGNLSLLNAERKVAVVGSRNCSINTSNFTRKISREISSYGYFIVSGLARGVDAASHIGSLENGTIAVLGNGIDTIYPKENEYLYHEILDNNGLIISEFPIGTKPRPENFPIRNRTIAGISRGVLIISAGLGSGSLHTANQVLKYGREVLVLPGNPYDANYAGSNKLLQDGATMVIDARDVIENLESFRLTESTDHTDLDLEPDYGDFKSYQEEDNGSAAREDFRELTTEELLLSKLDHCPIDVGELVDNMDVGIGEINSILTKLNLEGKIYIDSGKVCLLGNPTIDG